MVAAAGDALPQAGMLDGLPGLKACSLRSGLLQEDALIMLDAQQLHGNVCRGLSKSWKDLNG